MRYLTHAALLLAAVVMLGGATCSQQISATTGTTLEERCAGYRSTLATLDAIRADRNLTEDEADRRLVYEGLIAGFCPPLPVTP